MKRIAQTWHFSLLLMMILIIVGCSQNSITPSTDKTSSDRHCSEEHFILLETPAQNQTINASDAPPVFKWFVGPSFSQTFTIEIQYSEDDAYVCRTITGGCSYLLSASDWDLIKSNDPSENSQKKIHWRIRVDCPQCPDDDLYYSGWGYFWINYE